MAQRYPELSNAHMEFIAEQKLFFVATATAESRINVSPKGMDSLRVLGPGRVIWLNVTGSGNETSAHIQRHPRMTIMFCSFEEKPLILRLYGTARVIHRADSDWQTLLSYFPPLPGARQVFDLAVELVQTSCGEAVPYYSYQGQRDSLNRWATKKGEQGLLTYRAEKNQESLDGIPTYIVSKGG